MIPMRGWQRLQRPRAYSPVVNALEDRTVYSTGITILSVVPNILTPPNGQSVMVRVQGNVYKTSPKEKPVVRYQVVDQYHQYEPSGRVIHVIPTGVNSYRFDVSIALPATRSSRNGPNAIGRQFSILVVSTVPDNSASAA